MISKGEKEKDLLSQKSKQSECEDMVLPVQDTLDVLSGKWRLLVMLSLSKGTKRFKQISSEIPNITDKMLSKELKDLEINQLIERIVIDTFPPTVEYSVTEHGKTLGKVVQELRNWGLEHRKMIIGK